MTLTWVREDRPLWDEDKQRIIGGSPTGALDLDHEADADLVGDWFRAEREGVVVGYGWMDSTWGGDTEILLAVDPAAQGQGLGSFVLSHLEWEAAQRGINYVYNTVRDTHPDHDQVHDWLLIRGYRGSESDASLRKHVSVDRPGPADEVPVAVVTGTTAEPGAVPPGREERGGYVDVEDHRY